MKPSIALWLEMLQYEKIETINDKKITIVNHIPVLSGLLSAWVQTLNEAGASIFLESDLQKTDEGEIWQIFAGEDTWQVADHDIFLPHVYGLEDENTVFDTVEAYRDSLTGYGNLIAGGDCLRLIGHAIDGTMPGFEPLSFEDSTYMVWKSDNCPEAFFYFDNTYEGRLKALQASQIRILNEFDRLCRKYHIQYYLGGGTLLGAIRHGGMIPWDDDVDVMMTRKQYRRFLKVTGEFGADFHYQSNKTDPDYHSVFDKIRLNGTVFKTYYSQQFEHMHQGVFMDVFIQDRTSGNKYLYKIHEFATLFARSLVFHKWENSDMHFYGKLKGLCKLMTIYKNRTSMEKLEKIQYRVVSAFRYFKTGYVYDSTGDHLRNGAYPESWLGSGRTAKFGDRVYPVPVEAEKYLTYLYGKDYMRMPAPQNRKATHPIMELKL